MIGRRVRDALRSLTRLRPARLRTRLVVWMLAAVGVAVLLLGLPLTAVVSQWSYSQAIGRAHDEAQRLAVVLGAVGDTDQFAQVLDATAGTLDARVTVLDAEGRVFGDSGQVTPGTGFDDAVVTRGRTGTSSGVVVDDMLITGLPTRINGVPVIVRIAEPAGPVRTRVRTALLAISGLGLTALAVGALLASWRARQLAEPLEALAVSARRLGEGDFGARAPRSHLVEIDDIATALDSTADRLRAALQRSGSFSADASHQLRTPLTALRLNLDALAAQLPAASTASPLSGSSASPSHGSSLPDVPQPDAGAAASLAAAEAEVDRLEMTIRELLELADAGLRPDRVDLLALTLDRLDGWRTLADAAGRAVRVTRDPVPLVRARSGAVGQALQVLLDNALAHGRGDVTVWLESVTRGQRSWVRLCVGDEGPGIRPQDLTVGAGRGLTLARSLLESEGGRMVVDSEHGGRVCLLLPAAGRDDDYADMAVAEAATETPNDPRTGS